MLAAAIAMLWSIEPAGGATYQYTKLYDDTPGGPLAGFGIPALNNLGQVAFWAQSTAFHGQAGLFLGNGGPATLEASSLIYTNIAASYLSLNNAGAIAFEGTAFGASGIFKAVGGSAVPITDSNHGLHSFGTAPQVNDAGQVVFHATPNAGPQTQTVFVGNGGFLVFPVHAADWGESINGTGVVALSTGPQVLEVPPVGPTTTVATASGNIDGFGYMKNNNAGDLIIGALLNDLTLALYTSHNGSLSYLAPFNTSHSDLQAFTINNSGGVAFWSTLGGIDGIFSGPDSLADRVIGVGDSLFGSPVAGLGFSPDGLNDNNQVAFFYQLANGRKGIALATPVPEPGTLALAVIAGAILGCRAWSARRRA